MTIQVTEELRKRLEEQKKEGMGEVGICATPEEGTRILSADYQ